MLKQKFLLDFGGKLGVQFLTALSGIVVARIAGPVVVGTLAYGLSFVSIFNFIPKLFGPSHIKLLSEGRDPAACNATFGILKLATVLLSAVLVIVAIVAKKTVIGTEFESPQHETVIYLTLLTSVLGGAVMFAKSTFVARTEQAKANLPDLMRSIVTAVLRIGVVLAGFGAVALASVNAMVTAAIIPLVLLWFKGNPVGRWDWALAKEYCQISVPFLVIAAADAVVMYSGVLILQWFSSSHEVGIYSAGYRIGGMLLLVAKTAGTIFFPMFSRADGRGDIGSIRAMIAKYERFVFVMVMPAVIMLSVFSEDVIVWLLGETYHASGDILGLVVLASFLLVWSMPYGNVLTGMGFFRIAAIINAVQATVFVALGLVLIPSRGAGLGGVGLAASLFGANLLLSTMWYAVAKQRAQLRPITGKWVYIAFGICLFITGTMLREVFASLVPVTVRVLLMILALFGTYGLMYGLRLMRRPDLDKVMDALNIKSAVSYIRQEVGW